MSHAGKLCAKSRLPHVLTTGPLRGKDQTRRKNLNRNHDSLPQNYSKVIEMIEIPQNNFAPHPAGTYTGNITAVTDQGEHESSFEGKTKLVPKMSIDIKSDTATTENGEPFVHREWCTVSRDDRSKLVKLRQALLGRPLTKAERDSLDENAEMIGRRVNYVIEHTFQNGKTYANIATWSLQKGAAGSSQTPAPGEGPSNGSDVGATDTTETDLTPMEDDLLF
jgi:hypothetical protein